jgi:Beta-propeller repeat.
MKLSVTKLSLSCIAAAGLITGTSASFAVQPAPARPAGGFVADTPVYFEAHEGQYLARGIECSIVIEPAQATMLLGKRTQKPDWTGAHKAIGSDVSRETRSVRLNLLGANTSATLSGVDALAARANYLIGNDASQWKTGIPLYQKVRVNEVYPGIDVIYYADQNGRLEYDFVVQPGADPGQIAFEIQGADRVRLDGGELVLKIGSEEVRQHAPVIFQERNGVRTVIQGGYHLTRKKTVTFEISSYDRTLPLVIDPVLSFSTYLGGSKAEYGWAVAVDDANNIYVAGETLSKTLPGGTNGVFQPKYAGGIGPFGDGFVAKYDGVTRSLSYLTYFGGKTDDGVLALAVDSATGEAYVTGFTDSRDFPVMPTNNLMSSITLSRSGRSNNSRRIFPVNAFVARLNPTGTALDFSVLLGGNRRDSGRAIALDGGDVFVAGMTESTNFNPVPNGAQTLHGGNGDGFVVRLTNLSDPVASYSTFLGGTNVEYAEAIAVRNQEVYITGFTTSTNFPVVNPITFTNALSTNVIVLNKLNMQPRRSVRLDAFVTKLSAAGDQWIYSSYLGSTNDDAGLAIDVDSAGNAYVTGYTFARMFNTNTIAQPRSTGSNYISHAFVTKLDPSGSNMIYSVDFGSSRTDRGTAIRVDEANNRAYVAGFTSWNNFFATNTVTDLRGTSAKRTAKTPFDAFVVALEEVGGSVVFTNATLFGGSGNDQPYSMALKNVGGTVTAWIAGQTTSQNFVVTNSYPPFQVQTNLGNVKKTKVADAFVAEIQFPAP